GRYRRLATSHRRSPRSSGLPLPRRWRARHPCRIARANGNSVRLSHGRRRHGAAHRLRERRQSPARARDRAATRDQHSDRARSRSRARSVLIAVQMTLCTVLLVCSMLFLHSLINARVIDPGFDPKGVVDASIDISSRNMSSERGRAFYEALRTRASQLPGVGSATLAAIVPLGGSNMQVGTWLEGGDANVQRPPALPWFNIVGPSYFETLGIP